MFELVGRSGEVAFCQLVKTLRGGSVGGFGLVYEWPSDYEMRGDVVEFPQSQAHADKVLPIYIFGCSDGWADLVVHEGRVLGYGMGNEHSLDCRNAVGHEALGMGGRRACLSRWLLVVPRHCF